MPYHLTETLLSWLPFLLGALLTGKMFLESGSE